MLNDWNCNNGWTVRKKPRNKVKKIKCIKIILSGFFLIINNFYQEVVDWLNNNFLLSDYFIITVSEKLFLLP